MGEDSWWTIPVASLVIVVSAVLVLSCGQTDRQTDRSEWYLAGGGDMSRSLTTASFVTENTPKCIISRVKFLLVAQSSPSLVSTTNTTLRQTDTHTYTDADDRYTHATPVGVIKFTRR